MQLGALLSGPSPNPTPPLLAAAVDQPPFASGLHDAFIPNAGMLMSVPRTRLSFACPAAPQLACAWSHAHTHMPKLETHPIDAL